MVDPTTLPLDEAMVFLFINHSRGHVEEHALHIMASVSERITPPDERLYDDFEVKNWTEMYGDKHSTGMGSVSYSPKVHGAVESLIKKGIIVRDQDKPLSLRLVY